MVTRGGVRDRQGVVGEVSIADPYQIIDNSCSIRSREGPVHFKDDILKGRSLDHRLHEQGRRFVDGLADDKRFMLPLPLR